MLVVARGALVGPACLLAAAGIPAESPEPRVDRARYLMGTVCQGSVFPSEGITAEGSAQALQAAFDEIARLEAVLSDYREDSELSRMNREAGAAPFPCSSDLFEFLLAAIGYSRETGGAFDVTAAPLVSLWDLRGAGRIPSSAEIERARRQVGFSLLGLDRTRSTVRFQAPGMRLDPGALGKGFALDAAARTLRSRGVRSAMLDFGGQILAIGAPPGAAAWEIDVAHPLDRSRPVTSLMVRDQSVATSGSSERGLIVEGRRLGHVVDPRTGAPIEALGSATVIAATGAEADALSTALLVMGPDAGLDWASARSGIEVLYLAAEGDRIVARSTPGLDSLRAPGAAAASQKESLVGRNDE
jgi:thiamine biosynthesis lipoprotein